MPPGGRLILGRVIAQLAQPLRRAVVRIPPVCQHAERPQARAVRRRWPVQVLARGVEQQEARLLLGVRGQRAKQAVVDALQPLALSRQQGGVAQAPSGAALAVVLLLVGSARVVINGALGAAPPRFRRSLAVLRVRLTRRHRRLRVGAVGAVRRHAAVAATQKASAGGDDRGMAFRGGEAAAKPTSSVPRGRYGSGSLEWRFGRVEPGGRRYPNRYCADGMGLFKS